MKVLEGQVWGNRSKDLRGMLERLAQKHEVRLTISGIKTGWITKTIDFEVEGVEDDLRAFQRDALVEVDA